MCCQLRHKPIFDRIEYLCARSLMDRARDFGSWGWGFDSLRARQKMLTFDEMNWFVYILECNDKTLYTGVTTNLIKREKVHNNGNGAKSLLGRLPVKSVHSEVYNTRSEALKREYEIKTWKREKKLELIRSGSSMVEQRTLNP